MRELNIRFWGIWGILLALANGCAKSEGATSERNADPAKETSAESALSLRLARTESLREQARQARGELVAFELVFEELHRALELESASLIHAIRAGLKEIQSGMIEGEPSEWQLEKEVEGSRLDPSNDCPRSRLKASGGEDEFTLVLEDCSQTEPLVLVTMKGDEIEFHPVPQAALSCKGRVGLEIRCEGLAFDLAGTHVEFTELVAGEGGILVSGRMEGSVLRGEFKWDAMNEKVVTQ